MLRQILPRLLISFFFRARDVDSARLVVPGGDAMAPPKLTRESPVAQVREPVCVDLLIGHARHEARLMFFSDEFERRAPKLGLLQKPLRRNQRLDDRPTAVAFRDGELVVNGLLK